MTESKVFVVYEEGFSFSFVGESCLFFFLVLHRSPLFLSCIIANQSCFCYHCGAYIGEAEDLTVLRTKFYKE